MWLICLACLDRLNQAIGPSLLPRCVVRRGIPATGLPAPLRTRTCPVQELKLTAGSTQARIDHYRARELLQPVAPVTATADARFAGTEQSTLHVRLHIRAAETGTIEPRQQRHQQR